MEASVPSVEYISDDEIRVRAITADGQEITLKISPCAAGAFGGALIAASAVCNAAPPKPSSGTQIREALFPVTGWEVGLSSAHTLPVLVLRVIGGATLAFQFSAEAARDVVEALRTEGEKAANVHAYQDTFTESLRTTILTEALKEAKKAQREE